MNKIELIILFLVLIVMPAIGNLLAKLREAKLPPRPGGQPQPAPPGKSVQDEINDFLRRVTQDRGLSQPLPSDAAEATKVPRKSASPPLPKRQPIAAEVVEPEPTGTGVTEHVRKFLGNTDFQRRSRELGEEVLQADKQFEQRLEGTFEHRLGQFVGAASQPSQPVDETLAGSPATLGTVTSGSLAALFATPDSIRQAVIINEIFQRPVHRW